MDLDEDLERLSEATSDLAPRGDFSSRVMAAIARAETEERDASEAGVPIESQGAAFAARTEALEPRAGFTDRVMGAVRVAAAEVDAEEPLDRIARRTEHVDTTAGFNERVMDRVRRQSERRGLGEGLSRNGLKALFAAAAVAAAAMFYASYSERNLDADVLTSVDAVEAGD
ncbi:MAG: hypothetical protein U0414_14555 [Polyangiaceae bacterium]